MHHLIIFACLIGAGCTTDELADDLIITPIPGAVAPDIEVARDGVIHVVYLKKNNVWYVRSHDDGASYSTPIRVNTEDGFASGGMFRGPDLTIGSTNSIHISWFNNSYRAKRPEDEGLMYTRLDSSGTAFEKDRNLGNRPGDSYSIAAHEDGHVAVFWVARGLYTRISTDGGETFSNVRAVPIPNSTCECCATRAAYSASGDLHFLFRGNDNNIRNMNHGRFSGGQETNGDTGARELQLTQLNSESWKINACPLSGSSLQIDRGVVTVAWESKGKIYFGTRQDEDGSAGFSEILVAESGKYPFALAGPDDFLVGWRSGKRLLWQRYDASGNPTGKIGSFRASSRDRPAGVVTASGKYLLIP